MRLHALRSAPAADLTPPRHHTPSRSYSGFDLSFDNFPDEKTVDPKAYLAALDTFSPVRSSLQFSTVTFENFPRIVNAFGGNFSRAFHSHFCLVFPPGIFPGILADFKR